MDVVLKLEHLMSHCKIVIFACYIPPEHSSRGRVAQSIFTCYIPPEHSSRGRVAQSIFTCYIPPEHSSRGRVAQSIFTCYIPPEHSSRGRVTQSIFTYLSSEIYRTISECDCMIVCGDFNARIGNLSDCIIDVDSIIISRSSIDKTTNKQGYDLIEFLQEMRMCTLNGRFEHHSFTYSLYIL